MTKTKSQLREEAVERLRKLNCMDVDAYQLLETVVDDAGEKVGYRVEIRKLIDLLTDNETCLNGNRTCPNADGTASNTHESHGDAQRSVSCSNMDTDKGEGAKATQDTRECADDSTIKEIESTTESLSDGTDSREKLEADCEKLIRNIQRRIFSGRDAGALRYQLKKLLDRQAAITEREHPGLTISDDESLINWHGKNYLLQSRVLNAERERDEFSLKLKHEMELNRNNRNAHDLERIAELTAEREQYRNNMLAQAEMFGEVTAERDMYRDRLGRAIDAAHDIIGLMGE